ncbi:MAG: hypothetical protein ACYDH2_00495 [Anaerolineaceae bacterium]
MESSQIEEAIGEISDVVNEMKVSMDTLEKYFELLLENRINQKLKRIFINDKEVLIYQLSNGKRSTRLIGEIMELSHNSVSILWKKWFEQGLMIIPVNGKSYKAKYKIIDLALSRDKVKD